MWSATLAVFFILSVNFVQAQNIVDYKVLWQSYGLSITDPTYTLTGPETDWLYTATFIPGAYDSLNVAVHTGDWTTSICGFAFYIGSVRLSGFNGGAAYSNTAYNFSVPLGQWNSTAVYVSFGAFLDVIKAGYTCDVFVDSVTVASPSANLLNVSSTTTFGLRIADLTNTDTDKIQAAYYQTFPFVAAESTFFYFAYQITYWDPNCQFNLYAQPSGSLVFAADAPQWSQNIYFNYTVDLSSYAGQTISMYLDLSLLNDDTLNYECHVWLNTLTLFNNATASFPTLGTTSSSSTGSTSTLGSTSSKGSTSTTAAAVTSTSTKSTSTTGKVSEANISSAGFKYIVFLLLVTVVLF